MLTFSSPLEVLYLRSIFPSPFGFLTQFSQTRILQEIEIGLVHTIGFNEEHDPLNGTF